MPNTSLQMPNMPILLPADQLFSQLMGNNKCAVLNKEKQRLIQVAYAKTMEFTNSVEDLLICLLIIFSKYERIYFLPFIL